jgi:glycosyltransferase involved in cell wall biosynthesis
MDAFPASLAFGISTHYTIAWHPFTRRFGVHPSLHPAVRPIIRLLERRFDVNHVYTGLADWHFLSVLGRRPIILTVTQRGNPGDRSLLRKVHHVVAESETLAEDARSAGVPNDRISVRYPGVDLTAFPAAPPPSVNGVWRCVFASSPESLSEVESKGLALLIELARLEPTFNLTVLWRPFSHRSDEALAAVRADAPANVTFKPGLIPGMHKEYAEAHFVVAPFKTVGKPAPNSVLEGLATGRPALVSDFTDLGDLLEREQAGVRFTPAIDDLRRAFHHLCRNYDRLQSNCRSCAERHFNLDDVVGHYASAYQAAAREGGQAAGSSR